MNAADILTTYDLSFTAEPVMENPFMPQESSDLLHWYCKLTADNIHFDFYISLGQDYAGAPDAEFALSRVLEDVGSYRACDGYAAFCELVGIDEDEGKARLAYDEIARMNDNIEHILSVGNELSEAPGM